MNPLKAAERLCFAVFGQAKNYELITVPPPERALYRPDWTKSLFKAVFAVYMLVTVIVLVKLLIATMSDTYQQIQAQSDIQWKFGLSRLIRSIDRTTTAPSPMNLITTSFLIVYGFCKDKVEINPVEVFELLFFAVFGQTTTSDLKTKNHEQSEWTEALFKTVFGIYLLVSVVVLINLLIAMMSDTYQKIQAQSDIEWKFGLSKLIRSMHRSTTEPSPLNLVTTWLFYVVQFYIKKVKKNKKGLNLFQVIGNFKEKQVSPRSKAAAKWLSKIKKESKLIPQEPVSAPSMYMNSPLAHPSDYRLYKTRIEDIVDWEIVANKYRALMGYIDEIIDSDQTEERFKNA